MGERKGEREKERKEGKRERGRDKERKREGEREIMLAGKYGHQDTQHDIQHQNGLVCDAQHK